MAVGGMSGQDVIDAPLYREADRLAYRILLSADGIGSVAAPSYPVRHAHACHNPCQRIVSWHFLSPCSLARERDVERGSPGGNPGPSSESVMSAAVMMVTGVETSKLARFKCVSFTRADSRTI